jgi:hypothetical protein
MTLSYTIRLIAATCLVATLCAWLPSEVGATCVTTPVKNGVVLPASQFADRQTASAAGSLNTAEVREALVGMWMVEFRAGDALFDQGLQHFHPDGTESMLSNGLSPSLGNVCLGVWAQVGPRTFKLRHMAWNWDAEGHLTGLFEMFVTVRVDRSGRAYTGTFVADSYDLSHQVIPELHAEGTVRGARLTVE